MNVLWRNARFVKPVFMRVSKKTLMVHYANVVGIRRLSMLACCHTDLVCYPTVACVP